MLLHLYQTSPFAQEGRRGAGEEQAKRAEEDSSVGSLKGVLLPEG